MVRSLILVVSTLAVVGVLFSVYQYATALKPDPQPPKLVNVEDLPEPPSPQDGDDDQKVIKIGAGGQLGKGERISHTWYEPGSTTPRLKAEVDRWEPVGDDSDEFYLVNPDVRLKTPEGQEVRVVSREAWVKLIRRGGGAYEAKSGRFVGAVEIDIDRLSEDERVKLPEDERDVADPSRMIHLTFEELSFDLEQSQISTEHAFSLRMQEAEMTAEGLLARYNEVDRRLEFFEILRGGALEVLAPSQLLDTSLPGGDETVVDEESADDEVVVDAAPSIPAVDESGIPIFIPGAPQPKPRKIQPYVAKARGDVSIHQRSGDEVVWRLTSDALRVLFDFGREEREATRLGKPITADGDAAESNEGDESELDKPEQNNERIRFVWSETLTITPEELISAADQEFSEKRLRLLATGDQVRFVDRQADVTCTLLEAQRDTQVLRLEGSEDKPIHVTSDQCSELTGVALLVDRGNQVARLIGPARVADGSGEQPIDVRFNDYAELLSSRHETTRKHPVTGEVQTIRREYISSATFVGDAQMKQGPQLVAGDTVFATFDPPTQSGGFGENVRTVEAQDDVVTVVETDKNMFTRMTCDDLKMAFVPDPGGSMKPRFAEALGDVFISQASRTVYARDQLTMYMVPMVKEKKPFSMTEARIVAINRGLDPAKVDWEKERLRYEQSVEYTVGLESLTARGAVSAFDPDEAMNISAETLACTFQNRRDIETADIEGAPGEEAVVQFGDFSVQAHEVHVDRVKDRIDVPGRGTVWFVTNRGLDGTVATSPQDVEIAWSKEMRFLAANNTAKFVGDVQAVTRRKVLPEASLMSWLRGGVEPTSIEGMTFDAHELDIHFVDREATRTAHSSVDTDWWVFEPLVNRMTRQSPSSQSSTIAFDKEPSYMVANDDVVAVFANVVPDSDVVQNRIRIASADMTVDLRSEMLTVPEAGSLLIEDYRIREIPQAGDNQSASADDTLPVGEAGLTAFTSSQSGLPSQTYITWEEAMTFFADRRRIDFQGDVRMDHRSGSKLPFAREMLKDHAFDVASARNIGRRTRFSGGSLMVEFGADSAADVAAAGMGQMSFGDVRQLEATGGVAIDDDTVSIRAFRIVKFDESELLKILGTKREPAEIFSATDSWSFLGNEMSYNLKSGKVDILEEHVVRIRR